MKAEEARKVASKIEEKASKEDYDKIILVISKAVNSGKFSVLVIDNILPSTIRKLQENGYKVKHLQTGINEYSYNISW